MFFLSNLVYSLNSYDVCQAIPDNLSIDYFLLADIPYQKCLYHFKKINYPYRPNECSILTKTSLCIVCSQKQKKLLQRNNKSIKQKANSLIVPLKPKAPIMSPNYSVVSN